ncbi:hypothetical protein NHE_0012 [Neorickettsia helminthoeca str. Oregon]|uniref:Uncharacterized protein n=1 Tax=Neorickettsia helminthoeca str. Oregon TaxID=1286528 RepID=X5HIX3_9RICK|nr:hypothetical protein NHE_0012 [Neorickettsia helminthoeca str. Oregon]
MSGCEIKRSFFSVPLHSKSCIGTEEAATATILIAHEAITFFIYAFSANAL